MPFLGLQGKRLLAGIACSAGMGFILFGESSITNVDMTLIEYPGYDNGVMGSVLGSDSFEAVFHLDSTMSGTVTAMFELGCIIGALVVSLFGEPFGRRQVIQGGALLICIGAAIQASSYSSAQLIV